MNALNVPLTLNDLLWQRQQAVNAAPANAVGQSQRLLLFALIRLLHRGEEF